VPEPERLPSGVARECVSAHEGVDHLFRSLVVERSGRGRPGSTSTGTNAG
jgi:hypothetical protein